MILTLEAKNGIGYIMPSKVNLNNIDKVLMNFRVTKPFNNVYIRVCLDGVEIKKVKKMYLLPAEMESLEINKDILKAGNLTLEVADA